MNTLQMKYLGLIGIGIFFLLFMNSCSEESTAFTDKDVFRYNEYANIQTLDPAFAKNNAIIWATNQLFEGLVQLDDALEVQAAIASSWEISEDAKQYTFNLRKDVYFHEHSLFGATKTRLVTAEDFVYSFDRLKDPKLAASGVWVLQNVASYKALNPHTFQIVLKQPFPAFLGLLAMKYCSVVPKEIVGYYKGDFARNPIGTGPFSFKFWEENTKLVFRKNPLYYEKDTIGKQLPYIEAIAITFLSDKQSEFLQFVKGNIDFISGLDASYKDELLSSEGYLSDKYKESTYVLSTPYLNTEYLGIYMEGSWTETNSKALRKAINYGFDRVKMVQYLRNNQGTPAHSGFIPKGLPGFQDSIGYSYQKKKAKGLVQQFIKETGITQPKITLTTDANYLDICEYLQRELQQININVQIEVMPSSTLRQNRSNGNLQIFRSSWVADYPDAENYLSLFYSKNFTPNGPNYFHFYNQEYDSLYEEAIKTTQDSVRVVLYQKMDKILIEEAPFIPLYYDKAIRFVSKKVSGLGTNPTNTLSLKRVKKSE